MYKKIKRKLNLIIMSISTTIYSLMITAYAEGDDITDSYVGETAAEREQSGLSGYAALQGGDAVSTVMELCKQISNIIFYVGVILLVWGIGNLTLSFKNEDADAKVKASMTVVVAIMLMAVKYMLNNVFGFNL